MKEKYVECLVYTGPILYLVYIIYLNNHKTLPNPCYYLWFTKEEMVWFVESHTLIKEKSRSRRQVFLVPKSKPSLPPAIVPYKNLLKQNPSSICLGPLNWLCGHLVNVTEKNTTQYTSKPNSSHFCFLQRSPVYSEGPLSKGLVKFLNHTVVVLSACWNHLPP